MLSRLCVICLLKYVQVTFCRIGTSWRYSVVVSMIKHIRHGVWLFRSCFWQHNDT